MDKQAEYNAMNINSESPTLLSVVVPVRKMAGKLGFLTHWLNQEATKSMQVIIVHDHYDDETTNELKQIISRTNTGNIRFLEGAFQQSWISKKCWTCSG